MRRAVIAASGPSLDAFDWKTVGQEDYVLAVNYAGVSCPRYDAVVCVDVWKAKIFDNVYPKNTLMFAFDTSGVALHEYANCKEFPNCPTKIRSSSAGLGLYILHQLGYEDITAVGFDMMFSNKYVHARSLIDAGFYTSDEQSVCEPLRNAISLALDTLNFKTVSFFCGKKN